MATPTHKVDVLSDGSLVESSQHVYGRVKSTWDLRGYSRPSWNDKEAGRNWIFKVKSLPDMWRISEQTKGYPEFVRLDYERQHYLMKINAEMQLNQVFTRDEYFTWWNDLDSEIKTQYINWLTSSLADDRSHTNKYGMNNMRNYLTGERMDMDYPKFGKLITGRACVRFVMDGDLPRLRNVPGVGLCIGFECISALDYWHLSPLIEWWLFDEPMITARIMIRDKSGVKLVRDDLHKPFGQFDNQLVFPMWLPTETTAYILLNQMDWPVVGDRTKLWKF